MNNKYLAIIVGIIVLLVGGGVLLAMNNDEGADNTPNPNATSSIPNTPAPTSTAPTSTTGDQTTSTVNQIKIAVLDTAGTSSGKPRACDKVVLINRTISPTTQPLNGALSELFKIEESNVNGWFNFIARTNDTLKFDRATIASGTAKIYLTGKLTGLAGICDDPRAQIQIEETALQFPTVTAVELYLNGMRTTLTPSER